MKKCINQYFKNDSLKFAELLRNHLMEKMKPKLFNKKYPAFEVTYIDDDHTDIPSK